MVGLARVLFILLAFCSVGSAQTAVYRGRTYTPESFPRASWCSCSMCQSIRAQWASSTKEIVPSAKEIVKTAPEHPSQFRTETRFRMEAYQVKQCVGGVCQMVTKYRTVPYTVRVPIEKPTPAPPEPKFDPTPEPVVAAMIEALQVQPGELFLDPGCGDGRLVVAAAKAGALARGIEIEPSIADKARKAIESAGVVAVVEVGDVSKRDEIKADCVGVYLFPDLLEEIVSKLKPGTRIASYAHEVPGLKNRELAVDGGVVYLATIPPKAM